MLERGGFGALVLWGQDWFANPSNTPIVRVKEQMSLTLSGDQI